GRHAQSIGRRHAALCVRRRKQQEGEQGNEDQLVFSIHACSSCDRRSFNNSHTRRTCASVVLILPIERRRVNWSLSLVCERKAAPLALSACMSCSLSASSRAARSCSVSCARGGQARKQTRLKGTGARRSHAGAASTQAAKSCARRQCSRMRAASPSCPK